MLYMCVRYILLATVLFLGLNEVAEAQTYVVTDPLLDAVIRVDAATGNRTIISGDPAGENVGTGADLTSPRAISVAPDGRIVLLDYFEFTTPSIIGIDPITGDRSFISGNGAGGGTDFTTPQESMVGPDGNVFVAQFDGSIIRVDAGTGDRTIVSDASTGTGPVLDKPQVILFDSAGDILAGDGDTIFRVDPVTGNRSIVTSDDGDPGGQVVGTGASIALISDLLVEPDGNILVMDSVNRVFVRVNPATGDRTFYHTGSVGTRPLFSGLQGFLMCSRNHSG